MQPVPRIFVSATSRDLRTARGLVSEGLRRMECLPIVQDDFPPDYKSVRDMLRTKIQDCNAVVHLAGFYYGAEPQPVLPGPDRRSFTQMEYEIAVELKLPCYVFLCGKDFPFDAHEPEPEDKQQLQLAHRERLLKRDELFYEFASPEELATRTRELQLSVEGLRKELAKERNRRRIAMVAAVAALLVAVVGGIWMSGRQAKQEAVNIEQTSEIASLKAQLEGPWIIVNKVNAATELLRLRLKDVPEEEIKLKAIALVAADVKKTPAEVKAAIDSATKLAEQLIAAARTEGEGDASQRDANRLLEAETLMKLAASHEAAANYKEALDSYQKAFDLLNPKVHPEQWLEALTSIASMDDELGLNDEAVAKNKQAMEFGETTPELGIGHELTVTATNNLLYHLRYTSKDLPAAEKLLRRVLKERERQLGADNEDTLRAKGDLAEVLAGEKQFDEAAELSSSALESSERLFGADAEVTMDIVNNLSNIYDEKGNLDKAIKLNRRVVAFQEESLGADDNYVIACKFVLGSMLERNDQLKEAGEIYAAVLEAREANLGPEHVDTIASMEAVSDVLTKEEEYKESEKLLRQVLELREKVQGADHADTLVSVDGLARLLWNQDDLPGAEKLFRRVLDTNERLHGANDPLTIESAASLGDLLNAEENYKDAEPLQRRALAGREKTLKADDALIADSCFQLATALSNLDDTKEALPLAKRAVEIGKETLPADDETLVSYEDLVKQLSSEE